VAVLAVIVILVVVGVVRIATRRRGANESAFGAGGTATVPLGTVGTTKTMLAPSGVVRMVGEEWTARSGDGSEIAAGERVRVVGQDGLTLIVDPEPASAGT
jgi:membrane-bound serine protease (ClpP class)